MNRIILKKLSIKNFGPILEDEVEFGPFTYFVGRNNAGKSHYLKAIEILLATKAPTKDEMRKMQQDKTQEIEIEGYFEGVENYTDLISASNHREAINGLIQDGILRVVRKLNPDSEEAANVSIVGIRKPDGSIHNPGGLPANLLKVLPEVIPILATADTIDELKNTQNTALSKLKREALAAFFQELKIKTAETLSELDDFLHGEDANQRSQELIDFERHLSDELVGEFSDVIPSVKFNLPNEEVISKEMKIILDDGYPSEIEQKGHGLQRATLLALLRVLAKHGQRYQDRPSPIFLIGELESFLHPYAQKQYAKILLDLVDQYQIITTTHSPFIITPQGIGGYRRVVKSTQNKTESIMPQQDGINFDLIKRSLERRGNLEGLFADRIILIEGDHDEEFFQKLQEIFQLNPSDKTFLLFVKVNGKEELRQLRKFYKQMCFDDVALVCDLDYLFCNDAKNLLKEFSLNEQYPDQFRQHIEWSENGSPSLGYVLEKIGEKGEPSNFEALINQLKEQRVFIIRHGAPERYYKNNQGEKKGWMNVNSDEDLLEVDYLKGLMKEILQV